MLLQNKDPALVSHQTGFGGQATQKGTCKLETRTGKKKYTFPGCLNSAKNVDAEKSKNKGLAGN